MSFSCFRIFLVILLGLRLSTAALAQSADLDSDGDGVGNAEDPTPYFTSVPNLEFQGFVTTVGLNYEYTGENQVVVKDQSEIEFTSELNNDVTRTEKHTEVSKLIRSLDLSFDPSKLSSSVAKLNFGDETTTSSERTFNEVQKRRIFEKANKFVETIDTTRANFSAKAGIITGYLRFTNRSNDYIAVKSALISFRFVDEQGTVGEVMPQQEITNIQIPPATKKQPYFLYPIVNDTINTARIMSILRRNLIPLLNVDDIVIHDGDDESRPFLMYSKLEALTVPVTILGPASRLSKFYVSPEIADDGDIFDVLKKLPIDAIIDKENVTSILGVPSNGALKKPHEVKMSDLQNGQWIVGRDINATDDGDARFKVGQSYTVAFITNRDILRAFPDEYQVEINAKPGQETASPVCVQTDLSSGALTTENGRPFELRHGTVVRMRIATTILADKLTEVIPSRDYPASSSVPGPQPWTQWKQYWQYLDRFVNFSESRIDFEERPVRSSNLAEYRVLVSLGEAFVPLEGIVSRSGRVTDEASTGAIFVEFKITARDLADGAGPICILPRDEVTEKKDVGRTWAFDFPGGVAVTPGFARQMQEIASSLDSWRGAYPLQSRELKIRPQIQIQAEIERPIVLAE